MTDQQAKPKAEALNAQVIAQGKWLTEFKKKNKVGDLIDYDEYKSFIKKFEGYTKKEGIKLCKKWQKLSNEEQTEDRNKSFRLIANAISECIKSITSAKSLGHLLYCLISLEANLIVLQNVYDFECLGEGEWTSTDLILGQMAFASFSRSSQGRMRGDVLWGDMMQKSA